MCVVCVTIGETDRETERQRDRETEGDREKERQRNTEAERQRDRRFSGPGLRLGCCVALPGDQNSAVAAPRGH